MRITEADLTPIEAKLVAAARAIRPRAYAPYSGYAVGAAAADENGGIHVGANMEGVDYTLTVHAEQHTMNSMRLATDARAVGVIGATGRPVFYSNARGSWRTVD